MTSSRSTRTPRRRLRKRDAVATAPLRWNNGAHFRQATTRTLPPYAAGTSGPEPFTLRAGMDAMDFARVHAWLAASYWTPGIARERVEHAARHSAMVIGAFDAQ